MEHKELALLYSPDSGPEGPVQAVLAEMEISWRRVLCGELGQPVGALAGLSAPEEEVPVLQPFPRCALVFCGLTEQRLREALRRLNEAGAGRDWLKAVLTPHNRDWRFYDLLTELMREREAFLRMQRAAATPDPGPKQ